MGSFSDTVRANVAAANTNVQSTKTTEVAKPAVKADPVQTQVKADPKPEVKVEAKPEPKPWETAKHKIKYNDADQELSYQELIERAQKGMGADAKYQEAAAMRKQAEAALKLLKTDPTQAFKHLGVDAKQWASKYFEEIALESMLTDEQKADRDEKNKLMSAARELEEMKKANKEAEIKKFQEQYEQKLGQDMISTIEASGLPKTKEVGIRIAKKMMLYRDAGYKNVTPADVITEVKTEMMADIKSLLGNSDEGQLAAFLGDDAVKKLITARNKTIQSAQSPFNKTGSSKKAASKPKQEAPKPELRGNQWRKNIEAKFPKKG